MKNVTKNKFNINGYKIRIIITDKMWKQNCYLVTHQKSGEQILIDPGSRELFIKNTIQKNGTGEIKHILLTHAHFDHIGAVSYISKYFNVQCLIHKDDYKLLKQATMYTIRFGGKILEIPQNVSTFSSEPESYIGNCKISTILTPGHTMGGVSYIFEGFIFTGDTLLHESVGRADLPGSNLAALKNSVDTLLSCNSNDTLIFSGHGRHWSILEAKLWWKKANLSMPQHNMFIN